MPNYEKDYAKVVVKAWTDDAFRARLIANPRQVLNEEGFDFPEDMEITITPDSSNGSLVLGLPPKPAGLNDNELKAAADDVVPGFCC